MTTTSHITPSLYPCTSSNTNSNATPSTTVASTSTSTNNTTNKKMKIINMEFFSQKKHAYVHHSHSHTHTHTEVIQQQKGYKQDEDVNNVNNGLAGLEMILKVFRQFKQQEKEKDKENENENQKDDEEIDQELRKQRQIKQNTLLQKVRQSLNLSNIFLIENILENYLNSHKKPNINTPIIHLNTKQLTYLKPLTSKTPKLPISSQPTHSTQTHQKTLKKLSNKLSQSITYTQTLKQKLLQKQKQLKIKDQQLQSIKKQYNSWKNKNCRSMVLKQINQNYFQFMNKFAILSQGYRKPREVACEYNDNVDGDGNGNNGRQQNIFYRTLCKTQLDKQTKRYINSQDKQHRAYTHNYPQSTLNPTSPLNPTQNTNTNTTHNLQNLTNFTNSKSNMRVTSLRTNVNTKRSRTKYINKNIRVMRKTYAKQHPENDQNTHTNTHTNPTNKNLSKHPQNHSKSKSKSKSKSRSKHTQKQNLLHTRDSIANGLLIQQKQLNTCYNYNYSYSHNNRSNNYSITNSVNNFNVNSNGNGNGNNIGSVSNMKSKYLR